MEKGPQSYERENPWNRTLSTVLWVHKKLPQSTVKLVLSSNESCESKTSCNRTLATVLWVPLICLDARIFLCVGCVFFTKKTRINQMALQRCNVNFSARFLGWILEGEFRKVNFLRVNFLGPLLLNSGPKFWRPKFISQNSTLNSGFGGAKSPVQKFAPGKGSIGKIPEQIGKVPKKPGKLQVGQLSTNRDGRVRIGSVYTNFFEKCARTFRRELFDNFLRHESGNQRKSFRKTRSDEPFHFGWILPGGFSSSNPGINIWRPG